MTVSEGDLRKVASLARLAFSKDELRILVSDFNRMLSCFVKLDEVDTTGVSPTAHILGVKNRFREDLVEPSLPRAEALKNASAVKNGSFMVPQIMD
jgi:aspartyl-tRNA(Asn)/glutamyl-tRNA(Gln) amidotransferase subunit C